MQDILGVHFDTEARMFTLLFKAPICDNGEMAAVGLAFALGKQAEFLPLENYIKAVNSVVRTGVPEFGLKPGMAVPITWEEYQALQKDAEPEELDEQGRIDQLEEENERLREKLDEMREERDVLRIDLENLQRNM